jgi:hypothetical protein
MLFWKEHKDNTEYLHCGGSRYVKVINEDGASVTTKLEVNQPCYIPIRHARAHLLTYLRYWFHLNFIYMSSFIINLMIHLIYFIIVFICRALRPPDTNRRPFLRL